MNSGGVSSFPLRFAVSRVAGKALGDMVSVLFRRVLLMVTEEIDTARARAVSYFLGPDVKQHIRRV
jgi:hypothetical protein